MTAGLEEVDIASRRAALSLALAKKEVTGLDAAFARNALTSESLALRQTRAMDRMAQQAMRTRAMVSGAFAVGGAAAIVAGINQAAKFEQAMVSVRIATGATADEFDRFRRLVIGTSNVTAQSSVTIAGELAAAASAGLNNPARLRAAFPQLARAADVMWLGPKHLDPTESVTDLSKLSHLFAAYSGKPLHSMIDAATRLMYTQPETLSKLINQGKLFIPMALGAGVDMNSIFTEAMTMGQTGLLSGRGGAGLARYIQYMVGGATLTSHLSKARRAALLDLGMFDSSGHNKFIDSAGKFELEPSLQYLAQKRKTMLPSDFIRDVFSAFLQQGGYYVSAVTRDAVMKQRPLNAAAMARIAPPGEAVETAWKQYMHTTIGAWRLFVTNFGNLATAVFLPTLPAITAALTAMAGGLGLLNTYFMSNPVAAWAAALTAVGGVAGLAIYSAANVWRLIGRSLRWAPPLVAQPAAFGATSILGGFLGRVLAVSVVGLSAAAVGALIAGIFHEKNIVGGAPKHQAAREQWAMFGANRGLMPPGAGGVGPGFDPWGVRLLSGVPTNQGGAAFENDRLRRALQNHVSAPIIQRLTGTGATSVTDSVRTGSTETVEAIRVLGDRLENR